MKGAPAAVIICHGRPPVMLLSRLIRTQMTTKVGRDTRVEPEPFKKQSNGMRGS
jgi:hypothetical protein